MKVFSKKVKHQLLVLSSHLSALKRGNPKVRISAAIGGASALHIPPTNCKLRATHTQRVQCTERGCQVRSHLVTEVERCFLLIKISAKTVVMLKQAYMSNAMGKNKVYVVFL